MTRVALGAEPGGGEVADELERLERLALLPDQHGRLVGLHVDAQPVRLARAHHHLGLESHVAEQVLHEADDLRLVGHRLALGGRSGRPCDGLSTKHRCLERRLRRVLVELFLGHLARGVGRAHGRSPVSRRAPPRRRRPIGAAPAAPASDTPAAPSAPPDGGPARLPPLRRRRLRGSRGGKAAVLDRGLHLFLAHVHADLHLAATKQEARLLRLHDLEIDLAAVEAELLDGPVDGFLLVAALELLHDRRHCFGLLRPATPAPAPSASDPSSSWCRPAGRWRGRSGRSSTA